MYSCYLLTCHVKYIYIYKVKQIKKQKQANTERERESTNKANRKEVWFDFHIRYRGENIAKGLPPFRKN